MPKTLASRALEIKGFRVNLCVNIAERDWTRLQVDPALTLANVQFRLTAPGIDFWVDVRLRSWGDRWLAVADVGGEPEIGLGYSARRAVEGALASLGGHVAQALMKDPEVAAFTSESSRCDRSGEEGESSR